MPKKSSITSCVYCSWWVSGWPPVPAIVSIQKVASTGVALALPPAGLWLEARKAGIAGLGHVSPTPGFDVQPVRRLSRLVDLLHVGDPEHVDVRHRESLVRDRPVDPGEHELLVGAIELEEAIVPSRYAERAPDRVEAMPNPGAGSVPRSGRLSELPERIRRLRHRDAFSAHFWRASER